MKQKTAVLVMFLVILATQIVSAGVVFLGADGVPTSYTASTGQLAIIGSGLTITVGYDDGTPQGAIQNGIFNLTATRDSGTLFTGGTFEFSDGSAILLAGDIVTLEFTEVIMPQGKYLIGSGDANVLSGDYKVYFGDSAEFISLTFWINPTFDNFEKNFSGLTKVNMNIPEPMSLIMLGMGGLTLLPKRN